jgi:large subunit ribosomal protein L28
MAKICELTGKRPIVGNHVSHSNVKTKRRFNPNLRLKKFYIPEIDEWVQIKLSTSALRTIDKKGLYAYLQELKKKGFDYGIV